MTDGRTDRQTHDETNSRFPQFCECAQKCIKHTNLGLRCRREINGRKYRL